MEAQLLEQMINYYRKREFFLVLFLSHIDKRFKTVLFKMAYAMHPIYVVLLKYLGWSLNLFETLNVEGLVVGKRGPTGFARQLIIVTTS